MTVSSTVRMLAAVLVTAVVAGCGSASPVAPDQSSVAYSQTDFTIGTGTEATAGTTATIQYGGWLYSETGVDKKGTQFAGGTFSFTVGGNGVIKGVDMAVTGMKVGGSRRAIMPPSLAYGAAGNPPIPPNAALVFDIVLVNVQ